MTEPDSVDEFFAGAPDARALYEAVQRAVASVGPFEEHVSKSEISFRRDHPFAAVWMPRQYLRRGAALVVTIYLRDRDASPRWKQVVEPAPGRFTHHLELSDAADVDDQVLGWLTQAWEAAGP